MGRINQIQLIPFFSHSHSLSSLSPSFHALIFSCSPAERPKKRSLRFHIHLPLAPSLHALNRSCCADRPKKWCFPVHIRSCHFHHHYTLSFMLTNVAAKEIVFFVNIRSHSRFTLSFIHTHRSSGPRYGLFALTFTLTLILRSHSFILTDVVAQEMVFLR